MTNDIDATKATVLAKQYFEMQYGNLGLLLFRIEKVEPNTTENVWIVECSLYTSLGASKRTKYRVKINTQTNRIESVGTIGESD